MITGQKLINTFQENFWLFLCLSGKTYKRSFMFRTRIYMRWSALWFLMRMSLLLDGCRGWNVRIQPACGTSASGAVYWRWNGAVCIADSARYWNLIWNTMFFEGGFSLVFTFWLITFSPQNMQFLFDTFGYRRLWLNKLQFSKAQTT